MQDIGVLNILAHLIDAWAAHRQASIDCESAIAKAKSDYYQLLVDNLSDYNIASKKWWSVINEITQNKTEMESLFFLVIMM
jgi:hypothetical protein